MVGQWCIQTMMVPMRGMYGAFDAEFEVHRTIKRADLTAFLRLFRRTGSPPQLVWTTKGSSMGFGEEKRNALDQMPKMLDDLWIMIWEEVRRVHQEGIFLEVEHVNAHRTSREKQQVSLFKLLFTEGKESAEEVAQDDAMLDGGKMAQIRATTVQPKREEVYAALQ